MPDPSLSLRDEIVSFLDDKKASDITVIPLKDKSSLADFLIIATGTSQKHIQALAGYLEMFIKEKKLGPFRSDGDGASEWVVVDVGDILVHLFTEKARHHYDLEKIWSGDTLKTPSDFK